MDIIIPVLTLGFLGLLFGAGLSIASKRFEVKVNPRLEKIHGLLPGSNCGACGQAGCFGFAEGILSGKFKIDACRVANEKTKEEIASILGRKLIKLTKQIAVLHCNGGNKVKDRFKYDGIEDCTAANLVLGGQKACVYGCLGFDTCARVCPFSAINMGDNGLPKVDEKKCTACGKCVEICPKKLFSLVDNSKKYYVNCSSLDFGKDVSSVCAVGCIGCRRCEKACPVKAIQMKENLPIYDYQVCRNLGECFKVCPTSAIGKRG